METGGSCESQIREGKGSFVIMTQCASELERLLHMQVKSALGSKAHLERVWDGTLYHIDDLPFNSNMNDMPDVFTPFRNKASLLEAYQM